jgi:hypothetical protein
MDDGDELDAVYGKVVGVENFTTHKYTPISDTSDENIIVVQQDKTSYYKKKYSRYIHMNTITYIILCIFSIAVVSTSFVLDHIRQDSLILRFVLCITIIVFITLLFLLLIHMVIMYSSKKKRIGAYMINFYRIISSIGMIISNVIVIIFFVVPIVVLYKQSSENLIDMFLELDGGMKFVLILNGVLCSGMFIIFQLSLSFTWTQYGTHNLLHGT